MQNTRKNGNGSDRNRPISNQASESDTKDDRQNSGGEQDNKDDSNKDSEK